MLIKLSDMAREQPAKIFNMASNNTNKGKANVGIPFHKGFCGLQTVDGSRFSPRAFTSGPAKSELEPEECAVVFVSGHWGASAVL